MSEDEKPKIGDRVKLCGNHRYAGYSGVYIRDTPFMGRSLPLVRVTDGGVNVKTMVIDPEKQMKKA
ncbi:MAG: hypothetical protein ACREF8_06620 [Chthoniobacterales bacterium]